MQCSDVFWKLRFEFRSSYNVYGHHIPKAKISLILQHFLFNPSPNLRHLHTPHSRNPYQVCYGLIGNNPSFKIIPNTAYTVLILKKYNRSKSSLLTLCAGNIFRWRWCVYYLLKTRQENNVSFMPILCAPMKLGYAGDKILGSYFMQINNTG